MSWGKIWTGREVCDRMLRAYAELPNTAVFSRTKGNYEVIFGGAVTSLELIAFAASVLGATSERWLMLRAWARARAEKTSVRELCRQMGWDQTTLYRQRIAACDEIAAAFNDVRETTKVALSA
jgi:hypothetical protein